MQNLNDLEKMQGQMPKTQQPQVKMQPLPTGMPQNKRYSSQNLQQVQNERRLPTKFEQFMAVSAAIMIILLILGIFALVLVDDVKTKQQIQAGYERALNSPKIQKYKNEQARRQRELAKQKRLKQLGVDGVTEPYQKNDLLNEKLREQELAQKQERESLENGQIANDYTKELAAYNAKLQEVKAEEARILAEAKAAQERARIKAEQERLELERQKAEQERLELERRQAEEKRLAAVMAQQEAEAKARAVEQAERERAAKLKAEQEKAAREKEARIKAAQAKAAAAKAKLEAMKSKRNNL